MSPADWTCLLFREIQQDLERAADRTKIQRDKSDVVPLNAWEKFQEDNQTSLTTLSFL